MLPVILPYHSYHNWYYHLLFLPNLYKLNRAIFLFHPFSFLSQMYKSSRNSMKVIQYYCLKKENTYAVTAVLQIEPQLRFPDFPRFLVRTFLPWGKRTDFKNYVRLMSIHKMNQTFLCSIHDTSSNLRKGRTGSSPSILEYSDSPSHFWEEKNKLVESNTNNESEVWKYETYRR